MFLRLQVDKCASALILQVKGGEDRDENRGEDHACKGSEGHHAIALLSHLGFGPKG